MRSFALLLLLGCCFTDAIAQEQSGRQRSYPPEFAEAKTEVYKTVSDVELNIYIFNPRDHKATDRRAAIVFFFGGGWRSGTPAQFHEHCKYLASRGMVAMTADYRVSMRHGTKAVDCVRDGKSAIRWVRENAPQLGIDPERIAAGGGSAGGHVAACTGTINEFDESDENAQVSSKPNALVLFNPAVVLASTAGYDIDQQKLDSLRDRMGTDPRQLSPIHHVGKQVPPTILFHGKDDTTVAYKTVELFTAAMTKAGNRCRLVGFDGKTHGFFNYGRDDGTAYAATVRAMDEFLAELGFLAGAPTIGKEQE